MYSAYESPMFERLHTHWQAIVEQLHKHCVRQQDQLFVCGRSSRSPEGKKEVKGLHSTFAKAEAETVQPEKADHLILPAQRVDAAFPSHLSHRYCATKAVRELASSFCASSFVAVNTGDLFCCMHSNQELLNQSKDGCLI